MTKILHVPIIALMFISVLINGCNQTQLVTLTQTLGHSVAMIADLQGQPEVAAKLRSDTEVITAAIKGWKPGMPSSDIIHKINGLIRDLNLLPINDNYRPFILFALGTAAHIIEILSQGNPNAPRPETQVRLTKPPENEKEYKVNWDAIRASTPGVEKAPVL